MLNRYEFNQKQRRHHITAGQVYTVEGGLSYGVSKTVDVGAIGYYQQKVTEDSGTGRGEPRPGGGHRPGNQRILPLERSGGVLRYAYEFMAENRLQGHTVTLTLTKKL